MLDQLRADLRAYATPERQKAAAWFFKTGPGDYGEGDEFIGVTVPQQRIVAKKYYNLPLSDVETLLTSPIHEERLTALFIMVHQFKKGDQEVKKDIYDFYLSHTKHVNNWDLVDSSAHFIVGPWLEDKDRGVLDKLAHSSLLWERRIAIIATFHYLRTGKAEDSLRIASMLLHDKHDLIQKAVGWTLREVGKHCGRDIEEAFLLKHYKSMPRTALRYAIEHLPIERRQQYLQGNL